MPQALPVVRLVTDRLPSGPWIYARQVGPPEDPGAAPGALVEVLDLSGRFVGHGLYNPASDIRLRMLSYGKKSELAAVRPFLERRLAAADRIRRRRLRLEEVTDAYRVAHAEGDDLSGLVVDRLGPVLVCEHHSLGFWRLRADVEWALGRLYPGFPVVHRVPDAVRRAERFEPEADLHAAPGDAPPVEIHEHGLTLVVRPAGGHKTGHFCDQRENRLKVGRLCAGQDVLDLCCNTGGFGLQAARHGARRVRGVDLDETVIELARASAERSGLAVEHAHADAFDVLRALRDGSERPDVVVLDPHKLIRDRAHMEEGLKRYGDLNALALEVVRPGGLVATFSCSGLLDLGGFLGMVFQAARRARRGLRLLETLGAGPDHPQRPEFSRSRYLKGALLAVD
jgi:23S rRNA (cytosine1962-C5)-methyltransferase